MSTIRIANIISGVPNKTRRQTGVIWIYVKLPKITFVIIGRPSIILLAHLSADSKCKTTS